MANVNDGLSLVGEDRKRKHGNDSQSTYDLGKIQGNGRCKSVEKRKLGRPWMSI